MTNGPFLVTIGDDYPHAQRYADIVDAENAAIELSRTSYFRTAYVKRLGGQRNRQYHNGQLVGYLNGDERWVDCS